MNINSHMSDFLKVRDRLIKELRYPDTGATDDLAVQLFQAMATMEVADALNCIHDQMCEGG